MTKDSTWALQIYLDGDKELDEQFRQEAVLALRTQDSFTVRAQLARAIEAEFKQQLKNGILPEHTRKTLEDSLEFVDWTEVATRYLRSPS